MKTITKKERRVKERAGRARRRQRTAAWGELKEAIGEVNFPRIFGIFMGGIFLLEVVAQIVMAKGV